MKLYEINSEIMQLLESVDEDGEITAEQLTALTELNLAREEKHENIGLLIKNLTADSKALADEIQSLTQRKRTTDNKTKYLKRYLSDSLQGESLETARVKITFRRSTSVLVTDENIIPKQYLIEQEPKISRAEIAKALKAGHSVRGAELQENNNIQIK